MNTILLDEQQNIPLTSDLLEFMQRAYAMFNIFSKLGGESYILSGCEVVGQTANPGWVVLGGKLMPFNGGSVQATVRIKNESTVVQVGAGSRTQYVMFAEFGTSTNPSENFVFANLPRIKNLVQFNQDYIEELANIWAEFEGVYTSITNEASTRNQADVALGSRIDTEASTRSQADVAIENKINLRPVKTYIQEFGAWGDTGVKSKTWILPNDLKGKVINARASLIQDFEQYGYGVMDIATAALANSSTAKVRVFNDFQDGLLKVWVEFGATFPLENFGNNDKSNYGHIIIDYI